MKYKNLRSLYGRAGETCLEKNSSKGGGITCTLLLTLYFIVQTKITISYGFSS